MSMIEYTELKGGMYSFLFIIPFLYADGYTNQHIDGKQERVNSQHLK